MSPLKEIVPKDNNLRHKKAKNSSNLLNSLNESPMLKQETATFRGQAIKSKRVLNFDEEQQNLLRKPEEDKSKEPEKVSPRNVTPIERKSTSLLHAGSAQPAFPWKQQPPAATRLTPTNAKPTPVPHAELTQFSTTPAQPKTLPKPSAQGFVMALGKGRMFHQ